MPLCGTGFPYIETAVLVKIMLMNSLYVSANIEI